MWMTVTIVGLLVLGLVGLTGAAAIVVQRSTPEYEGRDSLAGLATPVDVRRDAQGVPHIYADTAEDLFRAQGYVHAQDRFFDMDFRRHVTSGRLSEWFGEDYIETDAFIRTLGWHQVAKQELARLEPASRGYLEAYAAGVNSYLESHRGSRLSAEYTWGLFGPESNPAPWTAEDSLAWLKAMAWDLNGNMRDEIDRVLAATEIDRERVADLYPSYPYGSGSGDGHAPTVTEPAPASGANRPGVGDGATAGRAHLSADLVAALEDMSKQVDRIPKLLGIGDGVGSNAWVVDGSKTATGKPMLANDPHLDQQLPSVWYQVGLHCRSRTPECPFRVAGFGFAGLPGVVIGHNDRIAWGFTNLEADVMDLYVERLDGQTFLYDGRPRPLTVRIEHIWVKGRDEPVELNVRITRHGPILSDVDNQMRRVAEEAPVAAEEPGGWNHVLALRWTALDASKTGDALFGINRARDWKSFREAAKSFDGPAQNLVYADVEGNIGYQAPGRIPVRQTGTGRWPAPGWQKEYGWIEFIPFGQLPSVLNPEEGFIVSANQAVAGPDYPWHLADNWAYGYRSERIRELIEEAGKLDVDAMQDIQLDDKHLFADFLVPKLLEVELDNDFVEEGRATLRGWDGSQRVDSAAAAYFNATWSNLLRATFGDELPEDAWPDGGDRWFEVVRQLLEDPNNLWWDDVTTKEKESADTILRRALIRARNDLTKSQSKDPAKWRWGKEHTLELRNPVLGQSGLPLVETFYNRGPIELPGGTDAVRATSWSAAAEDYAVTVVPSMRMVVDLADFDRSRWINPGGVSGHVRHEHYDDQLRPWVNGKTFRWRFSPPAIRQAARYELVLEPGYGASTVP